MPADMKEQIANAAKNLLLEKNVKKLTVKDIVEECHITRQTFYYHFEDVPHLLEWILEKGLEQMKEEAREHPDIKERLHYFFRMSIEIQPYIKKTLGTNYGQELEYLLKKEILALAEEMVEEEHLYQNLSREQMQILIRYHSTAIIGLLMDWTEKDTKNMDEIIDVVYQIMSGRIAFKLEEIF